MFKLPGKACSLPSSILVFRFGPIMNKTRSTNKENKKIYTAKVERLHQEFLLPKQTFLLIIFQFAYLLLSKVPQLFFVYSKCCIAISLLN